MKNIFFLIRTNKSQIQIQVCSMFSIKTSKICTYYLKILKICSYVHLFKKWSKYAFAYASMQMHNYPKPSDNTNTMIILTSSLGASIWAYPISHY